jgi:tetratricopeptide (TPR) repeat protein
LFDYSSAIKSVKKSIVLKEKDSLNLSFLAELYLSINKYDFAISTLEEILIIEAKNTNALISLAKIYTEKGDFVKAEEYYFLALECEPDNYGIYYELIKLNKLKEK